MKRALISYKPGLLKGLRSTTKTAKDTPGLTACVGVYPRDEVLTTKEDFEVLDITSLGGTFPYPQVFKLSLRTIACLADEIFELVGGAWVSQLDSLTPGCLWSVADFGPYTLLTNGQVTVEINPSNGGYFISSQPIGSCICANRGQIILGSPECELAVPNIDKLGYTHQSSPLSANADLTGGVS